MQRREQRTDLFKVQTEAGKVYEIAEITHQTYHEFLNPADNGWADGIKEYRVSVGGNANKKSNTEFEIVATGELAARI